MGETGAREGGGDGTTAAGRCPGADGGGTGGVGARAAGDERAARRGAAGDRRARGGGGGQLRGGGTGRGVRRWQHGAGTGQTLQCPWPGGADHCAGARGEADLRRRDARPGGGAGPTVTGPQAGRHGDVVAEHPRTRGAAGDLPCPKVAHHRANLARRGQFLSADAHLVPDGDGGPQAQGRRGAGGRSVDRGKKGAIDAA